MARQPRHSSKRSEHILSKTIVITGGSRGIGAATARLAGQRGWSVAVNYVGNEAAARETASVVEGAGGRAIVVQGDVAREADVVALFDAAAEAFGLIHGVVNNAGIAATAMKLAEMSAERLRRTAEVNIVGAQLVAREGVRRMARSRGGEGGVIVNLSSAAARIGGANERVDYGASKGALDTLTIGLSKEVGPEGFASWRCGRD
jgi:NAD(P)-dependent dehydrogenase (short-subunit alcohol dehydrogenase family)